ncbi:putative uncharacterized protein DDB_G0282499 [Chelonus insularis]|uniref:putative uncharacterized protein DDB_G0282499 n=1 Tax=Chelonus insularis TaxID=460826 RepID=UPI00158EF335|nr:putative uncharacterized protein DDB_G0282499 [Chelonus insularis]
MTDDQVSFQKFLVGWWTEEAECLLQRIERWTLPRRYNKLHSPRLSRGCMTMQNNQNDVSQWNCSSSRSSFPRPVQEHCSSLDEIRRINCRRTFYQSNNRFDSSCLDDYRYDHSIYFKTIGDIKSSKSKPELQQSCKEKTCKDLNDNNCDLSSDNVSDDEFLEIQNRPRPAPSLRPNQCWPNYSHPNMDNNNNAKINHTNNGENNHEIDKIFKSWPIVDIENLSNYKQNQPEQIIVNSNYTNQQSQGEVVKPTQLSSNPDSKHRTDLTRILNFHKSRRPKAVQQPMVYGNNNISWPRVLFSYNIDTTLAASHHCTLNVK